MQDFVLFGTLLNVLTVTVGSLVGLGIRRLGLGKKLGDRGKRFSDALFYAIGLCVILIGIDGAITGSVNGQIISAFPQGSVEFSEIYTERTLIIILSMVIGVLVGELVDIDRRVNSLGRRLESLMKGKGGNFAEGFVSASLLFCVGSMTVVGSMNSGISGDHTLLITKSVMDLISSMIFASTMGIGVLFSALFVLVYQGSITLIATGVGQFLSGDVITCMTTVGSLLIIALGLNLLGVTKLKIMNYLPAMLLPIGLIPLWDFVAGLVS